MTLQKRRPNTHSKIHERAALGRDWTTMQAKKKENKEYIPNRFAGQVALVVGGAHGIGKAIAVRLAQEGATVAIADMDRKTLGATGREIARSGGKVETVSCDVRDEAMVKRRVASVRRKCGRIDVLMQIAGVAKPAPFLKTTTKHFDWTLDTNVKGSFWQRAPCCPTWSSSGTGN